MLPKAWITFVVIEPFSTAALQQEEQEPQGGLGVTHPRVNMQHYVGVWCCIS